ncbi:MAG TPA: ISKra4 family transposase [Candidatus Bathyarchaeia archaeon]|nr:ISKra4 family transposase [Candidatus Bathyarchaeia archaeon]
MSEIARFTALAEKAYARSGTVDMEALEQGMRAAAMKDGAVALAALLRTIADHGPVACPRCGAAMESHGRRSKEIITLLGEVTIDRAYYGCEGCDDHLVPKDLLLDIEHTSFSPGVRRLMAKSGARESFARAREDLSDYAGIRVDAKDVERVAEAIGADIATREELTRREAMAGHHPAPCTPVPVLYIAADGTGVPVTKKETAGRKGKQGEAKTREAKLGCVFTQVKTDSKGFPVRQEGSTTYTGSIETAEVFGERLFAEALARGLVHADLVVVLGDGAHWIWNLAALHFPHALHIVDLYHAREHLFALLKLIFSPGAFSEARCREWSGWLDEGKVERIIAAASALLPKKRHDRKAARTEIEYFKTNSERMRYADFRARGLFVGSGVVEAGCKNVIGARMKKSGARWSVRGANDIIALRCTLASSRFEDYWAGRASV